VEELSLRCLAKENEGIHFNGLYRRLGTEIQLGSYSTLSEALKELVKRDFVRRRVVKSGGMHKTVYSITDLGLAELKKKRTSNIDRHQAESRHPKIMLGPPPSMPQGRISIHSPVDLRVLNRFPYAQVVPRVTLSLDKKNRKYGREILQKLNVSALAESLVRAVWITLYDAYRGKRVPRDLTEVYLWGRKGLDVDATLLVRFNGRDQDDFDLPTFLAKANAYNKNLELELQKWQKLAADKTNRQLVIEAFLAHHLTLPAKFYRLSDVAFLLQTLWKAGDLPNPPDRMEVQETLSRWQRERIITIDEGISIRESKKTILKTRMPDQGKLIDSILYYALASPAGKKGPFSELYSDMQSLVKEPNEHI